ncbi:MAG: HupE/UreJ family protein [Chitinophagaceae bacterium]|nr:HupE/UreJ family protein [Chitinophagaceae bacterium]
MQDIGLYFSWGWSHIISKEAFDHILFILALTIIYRLENWKQVLVLVTSFTIGHSVTLVLSVLDIIRFSSSWVEFLIPITIVLTATSNLFGFRSIDSVQTPKVNYILALVFGLIHGMGYANAIRFSLSSEQNIGFPLFAFNLGLEIGQIFIVLTILFFDTFIRRFTKLPKRLIVVIISTVVLLFALFMAITRIPKI